MESDNQAAAQDLIYNAYEAPDEEQARSLISQALTLDPNNADAYGYLATLTADPEERLMLYRRAVERGREALGENSFRELAGSFWGVFETRPYMRARAGLARTLSLIGALDEAKGHFWELLRLNPNDNQGVRYELAYCLLEANDLDGYEKLYAQYEDDGGAAWEFARALYYFKQDGSSDAAEAALRQAHDTNPYVVAYLTGREALPAELPGSYGFGSEEEAVLCVDDSYRTWRRTPGALAWVKRTLK